MPILSQIRCFNQWDKAMTQEQNVENVKYLQAYVREAEQSLKNEIVEKVSKLEDPYSHLNCVTDIVVAKLAEINSRLHVIEQVVLTEKAEVAKKIPSEVTPTHNLKSTDSVCIDATQIAHNENVYNLQHTSNGLPYRWTGPEVTNVFRLPVSRSSGKTAKIKLVNVIKKDVLNEIEVQVDSATVPHELVFEDGLNNIVVEIPIRDKKGETELALKIGATYSPSELGTFDDSRKLGLAVNSICIE